MLAAISGYGARMAAASATNTTLLSSGVPVSTSFTLASAHAGSSTKWFTGAAVNGVS